MTLISTRIFLVAAALFIAPAFAKPSSFALTVEQIQAIDAEATKAMKAQNVPGLALAVIKDGQPLLTKTWGSANLEHAAAVTPQTVFKLASISKHMIAAGVMVLVQDGKLALDDPVSKHLPGAPARWKAVTLRHLMNHSAGIVREGSAFNPYQPATDREVVVSAFDAPLVFPTGTKTQYCNVCYFALAEIISTTSGKAWPDFMRERVFMPAGMLATRTTTTRDLVPLRAAGYEPTKSTLAPAEDYIAVRPSGAFIATLNDMVAWEAFLRSGKVLTLKTVEEMSAPSTLNDGSIAPFGNDGKSSYGLGFQVSTLDHHRRIHHGGALPGFRTHFARYPDVGIAIVVLANGALQAARVEEAIARLVLPAKLLAKLPAQTP